MSVLNAMKMKSIHGYNEYSHGVCIRDIDEFLCALHGGQIEFSR